MKNGKKEFTDNQNDKNDPIYGWTFYDGKEKFEDSAINNKTSLSNEHENNSFYGQNFFIEENKEENKKESNYTEEEIPDWLNGHLEFVNRGLNCKKLLNEIDNFYCYIVRLEEDLTGQIDRSRSNPLIISKGLARIAKYPNIYFKQLLLYKNSSIMILSPKLITLWGIIPNKQFCRFIEDWRKMNKELLSLKKCIREAKINREKSLADEIFAPYGRKIKYEKGASKKYLSKIMILQHRYNFMKKEKKKGRSYSIALRNYIDELYKLKKIYSNALNGKELDKYKNLSSESEEVAKHVIKITPEDFIKKYSNLKCNDLY